MKKIKICNGFEDIYAKDLREFIRILPDKSIPNPPYLGVIISEKIFNELCKIADSTPDSLEKELEDKAKQKWMGPQGGIIGKDVFYINFPLYEMQTSIQEISDITRRAAVWLHDNLPVGLKTYKLSPRKWFNTWQPTHRSSAGVTFKGDRRTPGLRIKAFREANNNLYTMDPIIGGMRFKDNKYRNIFGDSFANYFRESYFLHAIFEAWHKLPFDSNKGDLRLAADKFKLKAKFSVGLDCEKMDMHFCCEAFKRVIFLTGFWFGLPLEEIHQIIFWVDDLLSAPVIMEDCLYYPDTFWNLLSGLFPTHDIEGLMNIYTNVGAALEVGLTPQLSADFKLRPNHVYIKVCGDDVDVVFHKDCPEETRDKFIEVAMKLYAEWGQFAHPDKTEKGTDVSHFCKKIYALNQEARFKMGEYQGQKLYIPKYSLLKALNSLFHPENMPHFESIYDSKWWICSILDNCVGMKMYSAVVNHLVISNPELFNMEFINHKLSDYMISKLREDWWTNLTYEEGMLDESPTLALITKIIMKKING